MKTVTAIIVKDDKILLERRTEEPFKGKWVMPGGHVEKNEDVEKAVIREVKEETGLDFYDINFVKQYPEMFPEYKWEAITYVFAGNVKGELKANVESDMLRFVQLSKVEELDMGFEHKRIIKEVLL
ncbi:NUDIX domain-containing protein [Candidatus Woesearchaeota archaeon]|nr:NUDIX domain-containing protein [Candidatus Woesearchaeota archaeon]MBW3022067.1 NUDIX domain-containing protein [Candidatus Woesearchaeota archaeon]